MRTVPTLFLAALTLSACEKDAPSTDDTDVVDTDETADTEMIDTDGGETDVVVDCIGDELGDLSSLTWEVESLFAEVGATVTALLPDVATGDPDVLRVELYGGTATFPTLPQPGTYEIGDDDAQYATCGLCVLLLVDVTESGAASVLLATAGTVTFTDTEHGIVGTIEDATFSEVTIEPETFESTVVNACSETLSDVPVAAWWAEADCEDTIDEDGDGATDCDDSDCAELCPR